MKWYPSRKAAQILGVHPNTLRRWADAGKIAHVRTEAGQRLYDVDSFIGKSSQRIGVCYCRVSSAKQKDDLERQVEFMRSKFPGYQIVTDIGSGLNYQRKGLKSLLGRLLDREKLRLVVAHRDRLARFGFELINLTMSHYPTA
jgi:predicted site-specific integrase-resolvase